MPDNSPIVDLVGRLNSPTHGAPRSHLQLVAMQDIESLDRVHLDPDEIAQREVAILADTLEQLKLDAETIRSIQQRVENRVKNAQKLFHYATAVLAPINRFPAEVLARIFVLGKDLELNFSPRMSWVAQRWRNVALSTPELWNNIPLTGLGRVTAYISRSGSTPLDIEADLRTYRINTFDIRQCMKVLEPHRLRWHSVKVLLEDHDQAQPILRQLEGICSDVYQKAYHSCLNSIYFGVARGCDSISSHHNSSLNVFAIPSLKIIELLAVDFFCRPDNGTTSTTFTALVRLSLGSIEHMQLDADFHRSLYAMPNLTELVLDQCNFIVPNLINEPAPIPLEKLASMQLSLMPDEVVNLILTRIFAPNLRHFELIAHEMDGPSQILNWEMIRAKYAGLVVLKLSAITSPTTHSLLQWLSDLPQLAVLTVRFQERLSLKNAQRSSKKVLKSLADGRRCTKLHTIEVGVLDLEGIATLKGVLQSRALLRSGRVTIFLGYDMKGNVHENKDIIWMQSHLRKFRVRGGIDGGNDETASEESDDG
ncbi:unnamed protein product [Rhizoctonia solani]|uniref:F-box domain-containing protein n=1 Tax=Rhizoctonia solani TaxID=456999 RepID=A0A8H2WGC6_9AGAM|nr:unnamed protein product [Rhizoctonia solani]